MSKERRAGIANCDIDFSTVQQSRVLRCALGHDGNHGVSLGVLVYKVRDGLSDRIKGAAETGCTYTKFLSVGDSCEPKRGEQQGRTCDQV